MFLIIAFLFSLIVSSLIIYGQASCMSTAMQTKTLLDPAATQNATLLSNALTSHFGSMVFYWVTLTIGYLAPDHPGPVDSFYGPGRILKEVIYGPYELRIFEILPLMPFLSTLLIYRTLGLALLAASWPIISVKLVKHFRETPKSLLTTNGLLMALCWIASTAGLLGILFIIRSKFSILMSLLGRAARTL